MTASQIAPALILPLLAWRIYVRARRNIGRQPWRPRRLVVRAAFFGIICALYAVAVMTKPALLGALLGGVLLGLPLALWGLHLTEFVTTSEGKFYTPNLWIGLTLTLLFVGRLAFRMMVLYPAARTSGLTAPEFFQSSLTTGMFGLTAGYYVAYNIDLVRRGRKLLS
jgi:hypothetical protein